ncbi:hypothetical protein NHP190003_05170 [Helicobacter sp. NHP19-003]|uniref:Uncharacterized protein n=1 Tax=Helicobacter gastrocanis TaxID=2849641 RepID=A0ABM7SC28_9HELI|nr:hypothetical protein [Helicobacter sp. NHP19-003]BCZ17235.1 hypothetical protein NHP190003_05170 [Helicobacter sp. NHP19-003]
MQVKDKRSPYVDLLGYAFYHYCQTKGLEGLGTYEDGQFGERQFVIKNFAIFAEPTGIRLTNTAEKNAIELDPIPLNLKNTDVWAEFERAITEIQKAIHLKNTPTTPTLAKSQP